MGLAMSNVIILGAQWGDEGKGKVVDLFSERFDVVARYQGGHNAGHTVRIGERKFVLKLIPSGILRPGKKAVIGNGLVVDPAALLEEIEMLEAAGLQVDGNLFISNRAQVLLPTHRLMEKLGDARPGRVSIGTTSRGIGPCYEDKIARRGIRIGDLMDREVFEPLFDTLVSEHQAAARALGLGDGLDAGAIRAEYERLAERIRPMVCDTARLLNDAIAAGQSVHVRRRAGHHAGYRSWHLPVRDLFQRLGGRRVHGHGRAARPASTASSAFRKPISRGWAAVPFRPKRWIPGAIRSAIAAMNSGP